jgi:RNA polymerase sigma-70 factor, ECF subfamily
MIQEALNRTSGQIGFKSRRVLDRSPEMLSKTRAAVVRAKRGDQEALRFLYVNYAGNIYGYVRRIVGDEHEAEDITQHVFAKLITALAKYDETGAPFVAWLLRLAHNTAIDHMRANRFTPMDNLPDPPAAPDLDLNRAETVRTAFAVLPEKQREVLILRHVAGLTHGEIAERMGQSQGSVRALDHRGCRKMQRELRRLESVPFTRGLRPRAAA